MSQQDLERLSQRKRLSGARIVSIGYPVNSLIKMILSRQGAKETVAGGRLTNFAQMLRDGEVEMKERIMLCDELRVSDIPIYVQDLVRCKDCKHRDPEDGKCDCGHTIQWQLPRPDDWFCADGKRTTE